VILIRSVGLPADEVLNFISPVLFPALVVTPSIVANEVFVPPLFDAHITAYPAPATSKLVYNLK
jgi:hypothetical protein